MDQNIELDLLTLWFPENINQLWKTSWILPGLFVFNNLQHAEAFRLPRFSRFCLLNRNCKCKLNSHLLPSVLRTADAFRWSMSYQVCVEKRYFFLDCVCACTLNCNLHKAWSKSNHLQDTKSTHLQDTKSTHLRYMSGKNKTPHFQANVADCWEKRAARKHV